MTSFSFAEMGNKTKFLQNVAYVLLFFLCCLEIYYQRAMNNYNAIVPLKMLHKLKLEPIFEGSFTVRALSPTPLIIRCSRLFHITKYNDVSQCFQLSAKKCHILQLVI